MSCVTICHNLPMYTQCKSSAVCQVSQHVKWCLDVSLCRGLWTWGCQELEWSNWVGQMSNRCAYAMMLALTVLDGGQPVPRLPGASKRFVMRWCDHALNISVWWGGAPAKTECARIRKGSRLSQRTRLVLSMALKTRLFLRCGMCAFSACVGIEKATLPKYKANRAFQGHKGWNDMKTHESETWNVVTWCDLLWDLRSSSRTACTTCQGSEHGGNLSWKETEKATSNIITSSNRIRP